MSIKPWEVSAAMLDPTWAPTNNPLAAPAIASPMRSRTWANFLTRDRIVVTHGARRHQVRKLGHFTVAWKVHDEADRQLAMSVTGHKTNMRLAADNVRFGQPPIQGTPAVDTF